MEAAAQQGYFEQMYKMMFETQTQWSDQQESKAEPVLRWTTTSAATDATPPTCRMTLHPFLPFLMSTP